MSNATSSDESFSYSYDSELEIEEVTTGYSNEPEYTEEELKNLPPLTSSDDSNDGGEVDLDSSRLENLHWCKCKGRCSIQPTIVECKCCKECDRLLSSRLHKIDCITQHEEFATLCLNTTVLETAFILHRRRNKIFKEYDKMSNKYVVVVRSVAYKMFFSSDHVSLCFA